MRFNILCLLLCIIPSLGFSQNPLTKSEIINNWRLTTNNNLKYNFYYKKNNDTRPKAMSYQLDQSIVDIFLDKLKRKDHKYSLQIYLGSRKRNPKEYNDGIPNIILYCQLVDSLDMNFKTDTFTLDTFNLPLDKYLIRWETRNYDAKRQVEEWKKVNTRNEFDRYFNSEKARELNSKNEKKKKIIETTLKSFSFLPESTKEIFDSLREDTSKRLYFHYGVDQALDNKCIKFRIIAHVETRENIENPYKNIIDVDAPFYNFASACPCYCPNTSPPPCQE